MYQNIWVDLNSRRKAIGGGNVKVHVWDDKTGYDVREYQNIAYKKHPAGTHFSLYGDKLVKTKRWSREAFDDGNILYADVMFETKFLVDTYHQSDEMSGGHKIMIFDIEVEVTDGFPDYKNPVNKITSIALYDNITEEYCCYILGDVKDYKKDNVCVESFESEQELLQAFYRKYLEINPTILTGWNIEFFDVPYLYARTKMIMGNKIANLLSPIQTVVYDKYHGKYKIAGVSQLDYLALYKLFTYSQQPSYRLDAIGQLEVGIGKVEYTGTLNDLYRDDIDKFIDYNVNDVKIVAELDKKLKFIDLARAVAHKGHIPYEYVYMSSRYLEGAILVYMKKLGIIPPNRPPMSGYDDRESKYSGAFVMDPVQGRHDWVYDLDLTSMYPSVIMSLNISPEMKLGRLNGWDPKEFVKGGDKTYTFTRNPAMKIKIPESINTRELKNIFDNNKISISDNGIMFKNNKQGLIPSILSKWFDERVEYKALMKKHGNAGNDSEYQYFKKRQLVQKILLNSMYGVLGSPVFRFYDVDNAEATTLTGQSLIKYTGDIANYYYNKELGDSDNHVIYTDTDSIFVSSLPIVKHRNPDADINDDAFMTEKILEVTGEVQDFINKSYDYFAKKFLNCDDHRFDIKQENIAKSAFWVAKKRYGQWIINENGVKCDKLDVKGLDIIRSSFPPAFRDLMTIVLKYILNNQDKQLIDDTILDFKSIMKEKPILDIALNTGVKGITKYTSKRVKGRFTELKKGTPVHVKAAIKYNDLVDHFKLNKEVEKIKNNDKIKWVYLKSNPFDIQSLALKGYDDPDQIMEFINTYIDYDKIFESQLNKKIKVFYQALNWPLPVDKKNTLERFF